MPAIANIVVADATPTNYTFEPQTASLGSSTWSTSTSATYEGNHRISISMSNPTAGRKTSRVKITLSCPFERTVDGVVKVVDTSLFTVDGVIPSGLTAAEALKVYTIFKNLISNAAVSSYLADRKPMY